MKSIRRCIDVGILYLLTAPVAYFQAVGAIPGEGSLAPLRYDVVSIRPAGPSPSYQGGKVTSDEMELILSLKGLIAYAYGVRPEFVFGGPKWAESDLFDIKAKVDETDVPAFERMSYLERANMLRPVLESRFGLRLHSETRVLRVFDLVVAKGGLRRKFTPHSPTKSGVGMSSTDSGFSGHGVDLPLFTKILSNLLSARIGHPIIDKTGLTGEYDFDLQWSTDVAPADEAAKDSHPDIFTAMKEQLGLKLKPNQEPVETMVIDSASKPSDN